MTRSDFIQRFKTGLYMATQSFAMVWQQKKLLLYLGIPTVINLITRIITYSVATNIPSPLLDIAQDILRGSQANTPLLRYAGSLFVMFLTTVLATFFSVSLIYHAMRIMQGNTATLRESFNAALLKLNSIFIWSIFVTLVTFIATLLINVFLINTSFLIISVICAALIIWWALYTYFVLPRITFHHEPIFQTMHHSWVNTKHHFVEIVGAEFWFAIIALLFIAPFLIVDLISRQALISPLLIFTTVILSEITLRCWLATAHTIFKAMLYKEHSQKHL